MMMREPATPTTCAGGGFVSFVLLRAFVVKGRTISAKEYEWSSRPA